MVARRHRTSAPPHVAITRRRDAASARLRVAASARPCCPTELLAHPPQLAGKTFYEIFMLIHELLMP